MTERTRQCVPCRPGSPKLTREEVRDRLRTVPDWSVSSDGTSISRRFRFKDFDEALAAVTAVAALARHEDHHPDIAFGWGYAEVALTTHAIGGLHGNDFVIAEGVDGLLAPQAPEPPNGSRRHPRRTR